MKDKNTLLVGRTAAKGRRETLLGMFVIAALTAAASAQGAANEGVAEIVDALDALKPDMGFVVVAGISLALIGMGAVAAISLGKRLMGK